MTSHPSYNHAGHVRAVLASSSCKNTTRAVLLEACRRASFDRPVSTFTKDQVCDYLCCSRRTIMRALAELREEGSLVPIKNERGGRSNATTYSLRVVGKQSGSVLEEGRGVEALEDERNRRFRALARKFGAVQALKMMQDE